MFLIALFAPAFSAELTDAPAGPATYALQSPSSRLYVLVRYDREALVAGHDHVIAASQFDGQVTWDPTNPSACDVRISFPVSALTVDPGDARSWEGLDGVTSDGDKVTIAKNIESKHQLNAALFPDVVFSSTSCTRSGAGFRVDGGLTLHGVTAPVTAQMAIDADGERFRARGTFTASHDDWGFAPFTALLGSLRNDDALKFVIDVKGAAR
jgi:polyisoprenoid-binding protein YceI